MKVFFTINIILTLFISFVKADENLISITVYPSKLDNRISGSKVDVIDYYKIEKNSYQTVGSLLSKLSSVHFSNLYYGNDSKSEVQIRGFGEQSSRNILILVNGKRINDLTIAKPNLGRIDLSNVAKIEVIKGGVSNVLFGDGAVGAAINIITLDPIYTGDKINLSQSYGSFKYNKTTLNLKNRIGKNIIEVFSNNSFGDGYRENDDFDFKNFNLTNTYLKSPHERLNFNFNMLDEHQRLPGSILISDFIENPRKTRYPKSWADEDIEEISFGYQNINKNFKTNFSFENKHQFTSDNYGGNTAYQNDTKLKTFSLNLEKSIPKYLKKQKTKFGIDYHKSYYDVNAITSNYINSATQNILEPYALLNFNTSKKLSIFTGFRTHHYMLDVYNETNSKTKILSNNEDNYSWSGGLDYKINKQKTFFSNISRSIRSPRLDETITIGSSPTVKNIKHQYSNEVEIGINHEYNKLDYRLSTYRKYIKNQIFYTFANGNDNHDPSIHQGIEIDMSYKIKKNIDLNFSAGVNESYFTKGDYKNNTTPYVPKYNLNSGITFKIFEDFDANLNHKHIGSRYVGNDEHNRLEKAEEYNVFDLSVSKNYNNFKFKSSINNIFDEEYYSTAIASSYSPYPVYVYPLPGRTFSLEVNYKF